MTKRQLCEQVRAWLEAQPRAQPNRRLESAATLVSWALYGAALEWRKQSDGQSAELLADEVLPLIAPTMTALGG